MTTKKLIPILFFLMVSAQILVPAQMIIHQENVMSQGKIMKFKTQPVDPSDPFRGKYINLNFEADEVVLTNRKDYRESETVFAILDTDSLGYAKINALSKVKPSKSTIFLKVKIDHFNYNDSTIVNVSLPFTKFYMNEHKAQTAENLYFQSVQEIKNTTCAVVAILDGDAAIKDVLIDGIPIKKAVDNATKNKQKK